MNVSITDSPAPRRRPFLAAVVFFANFYLFAFGLDSVLSIVDDLLQGLAGFDGLWPTRLGVALAVLLLSPLLIAILLFIPQLPKRVFLLLALCAIWANLIVWPLSVSVTEPLVNVPLTLVQCAVFVLAVFLLRRRTGRLYISVADLPVRARSLRRTLTTIGAVVATIVIAAPVVVATSFLTLIEQQTGGYLHFSWTGIEVQKVVLVKDDRTVHLVGMMHLGKQQFYRDVFGNIPPGAVVLVEGVTDAQGRLRGDRPAGRLAEVLGLDDQMAIQMEWMVESYGNGTGMLEGGADPERRTHIVRADIDVSEFSDSTIRYLSEVGDIYGARSLRDALERFSALNTQFSEEEAVLVWSEVIDKRNKKLLAVFDDEAPSNPVVVIPWGAAHMPGIEQGLRERGYEIQSRETLNVVEYAQLF